MSATFCMDPNDYTTAWAVYLVAAAVIAVLGWRVLHRFLAIELAILLECWLLALMLTPYYVLPEDDSIMAPALLIFVMDSITIEPTAGIRALIPLVMALALGLVVAVVLALCYRMLPRRGQAPTVAATTPAAAPAAVSLRERAAAQAYAEVAAPLPDAVEPAVSEPESVAPAPKRKKAGGRKASGGDTAGGAPRPRTRRKKADAPD